MKNRLIGALVGSLALSLAAALFAPPAHGAFHTYTSFKGKKQGQLKGETQKVKVKQKNDLAAESLHLKSVPTKNTKAAPKVSGKRFQSDLQPHPP